MFDNQVRIWAAIQKPTYWIAYKNEWIHEYKLNSIEFNKEYKWIHLE